MIVVTNETTIQITMEFEWDAAKAALNLKKHGIAFEDAVLVFCDPGRIETYDDDHREDRSAVYMWSIPFGTKKPSA